MKPIFADNDLSALSIQLRLDSSVLRLLSEIIVSETVNYFELYCEKYSMNRYQEKRFYETIQRMNTLMNMILEE